MFRKLTILIKFDAYINLPKKEFFLRIAKDYKITSLKNERNSSTLKQLQKDISIKIED
jgi:hypothetical protein